MKYKNNTQQIFFFIKLIIFFKFLSFSIFSEDLISGYFFSEKSTQEIQDDDFTNPGFIWVELGEKIWNQGSINNQNIKCTSCHGDINKMKGVSLKFPKVTENNGKLINLEQQINICKKNNMKQEEFVPEHKNLLALTTAITYQSKGLKQNIKINKKNKPWFEKGKKLYFKKIGQMGLACNQCHDERVGMNLRAEKVSQGHINGFPTYMLRWSKVASIHRRIQFCNEQARAVPFKIFSDEYNALQLYLTWRGKGLLIETPAVRK